MGKMNCVSNNNLIENSITKDTAVVVRLQINQRLLKLSPVALMIHWTFSRKLSKMSGSLTSTGEGGKEKYVQWLRLN